MLLIRFSFLYYINILISPFIFYTFISWNRLHLLIPVFWRSIFETLDRWIPKIDARQKNQQHGFFRQTFSFLRISRFFGLLYPDQVIEDRHEVLLNAPALLW